MSLLWTVPYRKKHWDRWDTSESGRFRTAQRFSKAGGIRPLLPSRQRRLFDQGNTMNVIETLSRAEAVIDRLAGEAADAMAKTPRESKPAAPRPRATRKAKTASVRLHSVT